MERKKKKEKKKEKRDVFVYCGVFIFCMWGG